MKAKQGNWVNRQKLCLILSNCLANRMRCGNFFSGCRGAGVCKVV